MRRTHIMHKRDNRLAHYYKQVDPMDRRPVLEWDPRGNIQVMMLDGQDVARVEPVGHQEYDSSKDQFFQRHDAIILAGLRAGERKAFPDDCDSARQFCESVFAP